MASKPLPAFMKKYEGSKKDMAADKKGAMSMQKKAGGKMPKFAKGGGIEVRGKTRGKMC